MAEKTVIETRTIFKITEDLEQLHDDFRIMQGMLIDQLCSYTPGDEESMGLSLERIHFLINLIPEKLANMKVMSAEMFVLDKVQRRDVIAA